ncbi:MAG: site-2 protease family protein [Actinomycetes bacterium]
MRDPLETVRITETRRGNVVVLAVILALVGLLFIVSPWVAAIIVGLVAMVMLHELGHLVAARRTGMKATEYFLGFGPRLWSFRRGETEYGIKAIPAGGYVRIIGMSNLDEVDPADDARTFRRSTTPRRLIVILAGVTVNALLALVLFSVAIAGQGRTYGGPSTTVASVQSGSAAAEAGLRVRDRIVSVDGGATPTWGALRRAIGSHGGVSSTFVVERRGRTVELTAVPKVEGGRGFLGVSPTAIEHPVGLLAAVPEGVKAMRDVTVGTVNGIGHIFTPSGMTQYGKNFTSSAPATGSVADQQRPRSLIGIVDQGSSLVAGDVWALLWLLGAVSLALALFNLLPLLPFDGGHAVVVVYEAIASRVRGRTVRVDFRKLMPVTAVVLAVFLTFGLSAMLLDLRDLAR